MPATTASRTGRGLSAALSVLALLAGAAAPPALAAPPNDEFATAAVLTGERATATGTNFEATKEAGEPNHAGDVGGHSVWWRWTAPTDGAVTIETCGSSFDTVMGVYTGDVVSALTTVVANDDATCGAASSTTFAATSSVTYWIAVDGRNDDTGNVSISLAPTLKVQATRLVRRDKVDATRFVIDIATGGEDDPGVPELALVRKGQAEDIDLELDGDTTGDTHFTYTFGWSCDRHGTWTWTVTGRRGGGPVSQKGTFTVPRCQKKAWFVSQSKVRVGFAKDFGREAAGRLRCRTVGKRKGSNAAKWRCTLVRPGLTCRGSFLFRYTKTFQGGEMVERKRTPSGSVSCRG